jgi:hypothetical protein
MRRTIEKSNSGIGYARVCLAGLLLCDRAPRQNFGNAEPRDPLWFIAETELFLEESINRSTRVNACELVEGIRRNLHPELNVESNAAPRKPTQAYSIIVTDVRRSRASLIPRPFLTQQSNSGIVQHSQFGSTISALLIARVDSTI